MDFNEFMGSGAPVWELKSDKHRCKMELDLEIVFGAILIEFSTFREPFWEPKRDLRGDC